MGSAAPTAAWPSISSFPSTRYLIPLGDLDPREAAPLTDAGLTSYHAVKRSVHLLGPGSTAVVIGAGGLGQMAIQVLKALASATTVVAVDTSEDKLKIAKDMGADEVLISGDDAVKRIKDITKGQGAELVLDFVGVNPTLSMAAQVARVLGHLTIVGVGNATLPVNFSSPPHECAVASPFWGTIPELIEVISLAQTGKITMLVEHFALDVRARLRPAARRQDPGTRRHHTERLARSQCDVPISVHDSAPGSTFSPPCRWRSPSPPRRRRG